MNTDKELESIKIAAGKRTYFIDVKQTREGVNYLKIGENKRLDNGEYERHRIMVFEEDLNNILGGIRSVLKHFSSYKKPEQKSKMEETKAEYTNAYKPWTEEEELKLTELFCQGKKTKEIAGILQRNTGAINSRIEKLELKMKYGY